MAARGTQRIDPLHCSAVGCDHAAPDYPMVEQYWRFDAPPLTSQEVRVVLCQPCSQVIERTDHDFGGAA